MSSFEEWAEKYTKMKKEEMTLTAKLRELENEIGVIRRLARASCGEMLDTILENKEDERRALRARIGKLSDALRNAKYGD